MNREKIRLRRGMMNEKRENKVKKRKNASKTQIRLSSAYTHTYIPTYIYTYIDT